MLMEVLDTDEKRERRLVHIPMGRFGFAEEMAEAALWLASEESSYTTGTEFMVDGGIYCGISEAGVAQLGVLPTEVVDEDGHG